MSVPQQPPIEIGSCFDKGRKHDGRNPVRMWHNTVCPPITSGEPALGFNPIVNGFV
jgi:hypothetical protein